MSRLRIPQRVRIYLGCEGQSEQSYGRRLSQIADAAGLHIHLDTDPLCGGDPLAIVELAVRQIHQRKRLRGDFAVRAILLDRDTLGIKPERDTQIEPLAGQNRLQLIWQTLATRASCSGIWRGTKSSAATNERSCIAGIEARLGRISQANGGNAPF